ncbi:Outer membrane protein beta-barrel domain-containing protein [Chitinophaga jiangningensis]|uniref:Outer membrane protein beta-barrel domain-containing protein n=1 Tax=Chitinophaga jiangningensis TaxID=1419482 RepID=A0A1M7EKL3_9BACT|nr:outer membrane beta-barrel protein [Chitinophaga jiangningensis]SHL92234.1 Outer membrane protein beta-barrel domain-containing protein [Chitinophaga jiangningensis]
MNDNFENSIRKKLQEADFPFDQEAWNQMENLLNKDKDDDKPPIWWWLILPLCAIIIAVVFHLFQQPERKPDQLTVASPTTDSAIVLHTPGATKEEKREIRKTTEKATFTSPQTNHKKSFYQGTFTTKNDAEITAENITPGAFDTWHKVYNFNVYTKIDNTVEIPVISGITADTISLKPKTKKSFNRLYAGLSAGPDYNVAASFKYARLGFNLGAVLHYYFKPRWFISTGITYSKKIYGATPQDYKGTYNSYLKKIDADCNVLEIPLNINYVFLKKKNFSLSATAGTSSYFMLKEQYNYRYNNPSYDKEAVVTNENKHYLAVLNVGALYQQPVGNRLILGVQPYAKIPLSGVGAGQVKLYSSGITLQLTLTGRKK